MIFVVQPGHAALDKPVKHNCEPVIDLRKNGMGSTGRVGSHEVVVFVCVFDSDAIELRSVYTQILHQRVHPANQADGSIKRGRPLGRDVLAKLIMDLPTADRLKKG